VRKQLGIQIEIVTEAAHSLSIRLDGLNLIANSTNTNAYYNKQHMMQREQMLANIDYLQKLSDEIISTLEKLTKDAEGWK